MTDRLVRSETADGVATVTLDSPANRNALSSTLVAQLLAALTAAVDDPAVRVIVLTGAGPVFCSGADLSERRSAAGPAPTGSAADLMSLLWESPTPTVARVNGPARAGGIGLLAACDLAIAPASATFAFTEVRIGVVPALIAVPVLRRLPQPVALELFLTGEAVTAERAAAVGLLTAAPEPEAFEGTVRAYVASLLRGGPEALALTKQLVRLVPTLDVAEGFRQMAELSAERFGSAEGREGMAAFAEKRQPAWVPAGRGAV